MPQSGTRVITAGIQNQPLWFVSGEVDFLTVDFRYVMSGESASSNAGVPLTNWYIPAGLTGFLSGTAAGSSAMWVKVSATAAHNVNSAYLCSARVITNSAKSLIEVFYARVHTGLL